MNRLLGSEDRNPPILGAEFHKFRATRLERREQRRLCQQAWEQSGHDLESIWLDYVGHGGSAGLLEFDGYFHGGLIMPRLEWLVLDQTLWERRSFTR